MYELSAREQRVQRLKPWRFPKGTSGNPKGRPPSPVTRIKEIWKENPELFDEWIVEYLEDKKNRKHIVEMVEGKPKQQTDITSGGQSINFVVPNEIADKNQIHDEKD